MGLREVALSWLDKARRFADSARLEAENGHHDISAFDSQQAAEMALKAVLIAKTGYKPMTHSLTELLEAISELMDVPDEIRECAWLEEHYVQAGYPDARPRDYSRGEAEAAARCGEVVLRYAEGVLEVPGREG